MNNARKNKINEIHIDEIKKSAKIINIILTDHEKNYLKYALSKKYIFLKKVKLILLNKEFKFI